MVLHIGAWNVVDVCEGLDVRIVEREHRDDAAEICDGGILVGRLRQRIYDAFSEDIIRLS